MPKAPFGDVLRFMHAACGSQGTCDLGDRELLERFLIQREESAFMFLVRRHGPMVLGVCRRVLGDSHEAEDVFQATFLVLVRRANSIRRRGSVGGWLYGVAQRIALKARSQTAARRRRESEAGAMRAARPDADLSSQEFRSALDEALGAVPEKYRTPLVLLDGKLAAPSVATNLGEIEDQVGSVHEQSTAVPRAEWGHSKQAAQLHRSAFQGVRQKGLGTMEPDRGVSSRSESRL